MIELNIEEVMKSFDELEKTMNRKFQFMFTEFFYNIGKIAIMKTPYGDHENYERLYNARSTTFFGRMLPDTAGTARNAWAFSAPPGSGVLNNNMLFSSPSSQFMAGWQSGGKDGGIAKTRIQTQLSDFIFGETSFAVIYNTAPYITKNSAYFSNNGKDWSGATGGLEQGHSPQAPDGILNPTVSEIKSLYSSAARLRTLFKRG